MSITDELREWLKSLYTPNSATVKDEGERIADRIDAEHERLCSRSRSNGYSDGFNDGFNDIESWVVDHEDEMAKQGWVRLPKDADGEYIHIGDKLIDEDDKPQKPAIVKCILYNDEGCVVSDIDPRGCWYDPSLLRHYHAPTVEDVLTEMVAKVIERGELTNGAAQTIAEYAAKLRLAEGEDA